MNSKSLIALFNIYQLFKIGMNFPQTLRILQDFDLFLEEFNKNSVSCEILNSIRLLAAYYMGYPIIYSNIPHKSLPNLYEWPKDGSIFSIFIYNKVENS